MSDPTPSAMSAPSRILVAGFGGGLVDLIYATAVGATKGRSFEQVWQGVASGWLGKAASDGGWATAALGLLTHFGIALSMALAYALAASRMPVLLRRPWFCGLAYGFVLYAVMYGVVLPLRFPQAFPRWDGVLSVTDILSHIGVALVIALTLSRNPPAKH